MKPHPRDPRWIRNESGRVLVDHAGRPLRRRAFDTDPRGGRSGQGRYGPYEGANWNRRTAGWPNVYSDDPSVASYVLWRLRQQSRDLVRNNEHAESAASVIVDHVIGEGIKAATQDERWRTWADTTACDAAGQMTFAGLQALAMDTVFQSGEVLIRRRWRRRSDNLPLPFQLQMLEPDHLATGYDRKLKQGRHVVHGIEFDRRQRRTAYYLYKHHPSSRYNNHGSYASAEFGRSSLLGEYIRVPAVDVAHVYLKRRAGQERGVPWLAPVMLRTRNLDEFEDATLEKQKIAAMLTAMFTDPTGGMPPPGLPETGESADEPAWIEPGTVATSPPGRDVKFFEPPSVSDYADYTSVNLHRIASGLGVAYEDLSGHYQRLPFSAAKMSRQRHWKRVTRWRMQMILPMLLQRVWGWAVEASLLVEDGDPLPMMVEWAAPGMEALDEQAHVLAASRRILSGLSTPDDEIRARGKDPAAHWDEYAANFKRLDKLGITIASDPRHKEGQDTDPSTQFSANAGSTYCPDCGVGYRGGECPVCGGDSR